MGKAHYNLADIHMKNSVIHLFIKHECAHKNNAIPNNMCLRVYAIIV